MRLWVGAHTPVGTEITLEKGVEDAPTGAITTPGLVSRITIVVSPRRVVFRPRPHDLQKLLVSDVFGSQ